MGRRTTKRQNIFTSQDWDDSVFHDDLNGLAGRGQYAQIQPRLLERQAQTVNGIYVLERPQGSPGIQLRLALLEGRIPPSTVKFSQSDPRETKPSFTEQSCS